MKGFKEMLQELLTKYSEAQMAEMLGVSQRSVYNYLREYSNPYKSTERKLSEIYKRENENLTYTEQRRQQKNTEETYMVPFVDVPARAGYTQAYSQRDYIATLKKYPILPDVDPTGAIWRYFQIAGDSMEPEFRDGDTILCSQVPREDWNEFKDYHTYVLVTDSDLWIKDVYKDSSDQWILLSQNETYNPFVVKVEDVRQLWVMRRHIKARAKKARMYDIKEIRKNLKPGK